MKKLILTPLFLSVLIALIGADFHREGTGTTSSETPKKFCNGYTIIEYGKGIDCNGDTVRLVKVNGVQELQREPS